MNDKMNSKYCVRTDLACESVNDNCEQEEFIENGIIIKKTFIDYNNAKETGRKPGLYYTLDTRAVKTHDNDDIVNCENVLAKVIKDVMNYESINDKAKGLIIGLGNVNITPDSLGPLVIDNVIVTRHMFIVDPTHVSEGIREISAIAPGVMGTTGIETYDIIEAVIKKVPVDYLMVIDALAARSIERINKTIQVTNSGISPGSGVGNRRKEISKATFGLPVIAIGVPTVCDAVTITSDAIDIIMRYMDNMNRNINEKVNLDSPKPSEESCKQFFGPFGSLSEEEKRNLIDEILTPNGYNMMVTPKEVDLDIADLTQIISRAIDQATHPIVGPYAN